MRRNKRKNTLIKSHRRDTRSKIYNTKVPVNEAFHSFEMHLLFAQLKLKYYTIQSELGGVLR
jgi:hypothetical protein